jgi:hypothetical protein
MFSYFLAMERLKQQILKKRGEMSRSSVDATPKLPSDTSKESLKEIVTEVPKQASKVVLKDSPREAPPRPPRKFATNTGPPSLVDTMVVTQDEENRLEDRVFDRVTEEKLLAAEAARSGFMKEEQTLKDCLNKLHQTEAHLHGIQRDLDDTTYAEVRL